MLDKIPAELVQRNLALYKQLVQERHPNLDVSGGPFHDIILYYAAIFTALNQQQITEAFRLIKFGDLIKNPDSVPEGLLNQIAENYLTKRRPGDYAKGLVTIIFSKQVISVIPDNTEFIYEHLMFKPATTFTARATGGATVLENDRIFVNIREGLAITIPVNATKIGEEGNISDRAVFRINNKPASVIKAFAQADFTGGLNVETNRQLVGRIQKRILGIKD